MPSSVDERCCLISDGSGPQSSFVGTANAGAPNEPLALDQTAVGHGANDIEERDGDPFSAGAASGPDAIAEEGSGESADNAPDSVSSVTTPQPSMWTQLLISFADLRARVLGGL
jgi:hypothetical protein